MKMGDLLLQLVSESHNLLFGSRRIFWLHSLVYSIYLCLQCKFKSACVALQFAYFCICSNKSKLAAHREEEGGAFPKGMLLL